MLTIKQIYTIAEKELRIWLQSPSNWLTILLVPFAFIFLLGTIFGGIILSYIDQAGVVEAYRHTKKRLVTVAMHEVKFIAPVFVGDLVSFYTETIRIGTTSITVQNGGRLRWLHGSRGGVMVGSLLIAALVAGGSSEPATPAWIRRDNVATLRRLAGLPVLGVLPYRRDLESLSARPAAFTRWVAARLRLPALPGGGP